MITDIGKALLATMACAVAVACMFRGCGLIGCATVPADAADTWPAEPYGDDDDTTAEASDPLPDTAEAWTELPGVEVLDLTLLPGGCAIDAGYALYSDTSPALTAPPLLVDYGSGWFAPVVAVVGGCPSGSVGDADVVTCGASVYLWSYDCADGACGDPVGSVRVMVAR
jgi:hypothetical protein